MKTILISGSNGFIAKNFIEKFGDVYKFIKLSHKSKNDHYTYDELLENLSLLKEVDVVINLAGANIAQRRWSNKRKKELISSRVKTTENLIKLFNPIKNKPHFISVSAVGIYNPNMHSNESSVIDYYNYKNFSQELTKKWELSSKTYKGNLTILRFGTVFSHSGGAFPKILNPFLIYLGNILGNGNQHFTWVALPDLLDIINFMVENKQIGIYNLIAPNIITFKELSLSISKVWGKPCWFNIPNFVIKLLFGEMGEELFLNNLIVHSKHLSDIKYNFKYPDIDKCLQAIKLKEI